MAHTEKTTTTNADGSETVTTTTYDDDGRVIAVSSTTHIKHLSGAVHLGSGKQIFHNK
ncbi:hypothetical protein [Marinactinospora rubrisoli]|uniref:YD repeat-containing protein n=1 Tax=Marinactinospora rubrisoli TaxID=2715399 RepID=A0ABW2KQ54_9ACTN